jgi:hypothetical protein
VVHLDAVVLPAAVRGLRLGGHRRGVRVDAHGRRGGLAPGPLDVRPRRDAADAGRRARPRAVRRERCAECAAVRVRPAHLRRGHRHLRPKGACVCIVTNGSKKMAIDDNQTTHIRRTCWMPTGFQQDALLLPCYLRRSHVHGARLPSTESSVHLFHLDMT